MSAAVQQAIAGALTAAANYERLTRLVQVRAARRPARQSIKDQQEAYAKVRSAQIRLELALRESGYA